MRCVETRKHEMNLVDPASSHMLRSRAKPCKCQSTRFMHSGSVNGSLDQLSSLRQCVVGTVTNGAQLDILNNFVANTRLKQSAIAAYLPKHQAATGVVVDCTQPCFKTSAFHKQHALWLTQAGPMWTQQLWQDTFKVVLVVL